MMGVFRVAVVFLNAEGTKSSLVEALVDTGATLSQLPSPLAEDLGLRPHRRGTFRYASGEPVDRDVAACRIAYEGVFINTEVVIGDEGAQPILGAVALEQLGYAVDPLGRELVRSPLWMLAAA